MQQFVKHLLVFLILNFLKICFSIIKQIFSNIPNFLQYLLDYFLKPTVFIVGCLCHVSVRPYGQVSSFGCRFFLGAIPLASANHQLWYHHWHELHSFGLKRVRGSSLSLAMAKYKKSIMAKPKHKKPRPGQTRHSNPIHTTTTTPTTTLVQCTPTAPV